MKLYFAGASKQRFHIARLAKAAESQGHTVTHRWWEVMDNPKVDYCRAAIDDLQGVADCEALVAVLDDVLISPGAHLELGYALALQKPILVIVTDWDRQLQESIWLHLPQIALVQMGEELDENLNGLAHQLHNAVTATRDVAASYEH